MFFQSNMILWFQYRSLPDTLPRVAKSLKGFTTRKHNDRVSVPRSGTATLLLSLPNTTEASTLPASLSNLATTSPPSLETGSGRFQKSYFASLLQHPPKSNGSTTCHHHLRGSRQLGPLNSVKPSGARYTLESCGRSRPGCMAFNMTELASMTTTSKT